MAITNLTARANFNRRKADYRRRRVRSGVRNIEGRIRNRNIKITQIFPQSRNIENKEKNGQVFRPIAVRRKSLYSNRPVEY